MQFSDGSDIRQQMLYVNRVVQQRIGHRYKKFSQLPQWYRGLSDMQMSAANSMQAALDDDILEGSAYRVYQLLHDMGLHPRPQKIELRRLFPISRGNDVAFLWFLMEVFYKSESHGNSYGINEQIIMSVVFWLDLYPTLHQLDRVLPVPHPSKDTRQKTEVRHIKMAKNTIIKNTGYVKFSHPKLPYFERPPKRKFLHRNLLGSKPKLPAKVPVVPPKYSSSTLATRWFGEFVFSDGQLVANRVLRNEIDNILSSLHAAKLNDSNVETMCVHHKQISEMERSLQVKLEKIKQQKREQLITIKDHAKERNRRRTLNQLDQLTEAYKAKFHDMAINTRRTFTRKRLYADSQDPGFICMNTGYSESNGNIGEPVCVLSERGEPLPPSCRDNMPSKNQSKSCAHFGNQPLHHRPSTLMRFLHMSDIGMEEEKAVEKDPSPAPTQDSCDRDKNKYFKTSGGFYSFNYRKLFTPSKSTHVDSEQLRLRELFIKALDDDVGYLNAVREGNASGSMTSLVNRSAKRMFTDATRQFENAEADLAKQNQAEQRLDFGQKYYDADNIDQMKEMLRLGLERVAQDHRYVLPTLPNVHSVPMLIEWMCARYGKLYSQDERRREFNKAKLIMSHLTHILRTLIVRRDRQRSSSRSSIFSMTDLDRMNRLQKQHWMRYLRSFVVSIMELGRIFQTTMHADQGVDSASAYYAYMPAHVKDMQFHTYMPILNRRKRSKLEIK